ncbi:hypothetical protein J4421_03955 [Candidatus Woesearchaeota archaeon]|nr:hypothetical protein [Candidatus Woesearchaeota archaeon]
MKPYLSLIIAITACAHVSPDLVNIQGCYTTFPGELLLRDAQKVAHQVNPEGYPQRFFDNLYNICREADQRGDNNGITTTKEASQLLRWLIDQENKRTKK